MGGKVLVTFPRTSAPAFVQRSSSPLNSITACLNPYKIVAGLGGQIGWRFWDCPHREDLRVETTSAQATMPSPLVDSANITPLGY